jgi:hypothetical protein
MKVKAIHHRSSGPADTFEVEDTATLYDFVKMLSRHDSFDYIDHKTRIMYAYEENKKKKGMVLTDLQVKLSEIPQIETGNFYITVTHNVWKSSPGYNDSGDSFVS